MNATDLIEIKKTAEFDIDGTIVDDNTIEYD